MDYNQNNFDNNQNFNNTQGTNDNGYVYDNNYAGGYNDPYSYNPQPQKESGMGIASLVLGICGFFINPFSICSILAIVFGIVVVCKKDCKKGCAIAGWILGGVSLFWDLLLTILTGGIMFFC